MSDEFVFDEWLAGFFEGDGTCFCIDVVSPVNGKSYTRTVATFIQKESQILEYVRSSTGLGCLYFAGERPGWHLKLNSHKQCSKLLDIFDGKVVISKTVDRLNVLAKYLGRKSLCLGEPSWSWFAGFWDAEGFSSVIRSSYEKSSGDISNYAYLVLGVSQKDDEVLLKIEKFMNAGGLYYPSENVSRTTSEWRVASDSAIRTARRLLVLSQNVSKRTKMVNELKELGIENQ